MRRYYLKPRPRSDDPPYWLFVVAVLVAAGSLAFLEGSGAPFLLVWPLRVLLGGLSVWTLIEGVRRWRAARRA